MKAFVSLIPLLFSLVASSQAFGIRPVLPEDFIGTWKLNKLADTHLEYLKDTVEFEILKFTKDSVFVTTIREHYAGTWKLVRGQTKINIKKTDKFNYEWIAGDTKSKFLTTKGLGYYKYFVRVSKP